MNWSIDDPRWLALGAVGLACAVLGWRWLRAVPRMRRAPAVLARVLLALACALALAGLHADRKADRVAVVAVVDLSESVASFADFGTTDAGRPISAQEAAWDLLARAAEGRGPDDPFGLVAFDARPVALATPTLDDPLARSPSFTPADGTDVLAALRLARAMLPADAAGRIVLVSDGRPTRGTLDDLAMDVPVDVAPIVYRVDRETTVASFDLPARSAANAEVEGRVVLESTGPVRGVVTVLRDGRPVDLDPDGPGVGVRVESDEPGGGRLVVPVRFALPDGRVHRYRAVFEPDRAEGPAGPVLFGDTSVSNNRADAFTISRSPGAVLLVDGPGRGEGSTLARTLRAAGREVELVVPGAFPTDLLDLEAFDLVVLDDVPYDALPRGAAERLDAYARDFGGGVVFVGGRSALTAGGWRGSAIEDALPVRLEIPDRVVMPEAAVVFVLDRSGSMGSSVLGSSQSQQEVANRAAAAAIDTLDPSDLVGVIAFSNNPSIIVPLGPNTDPGRTKQAVLGISSSGGTNLALALQTALNQLESVRTRTRHVIVLSDGMSLEPERLPGLAAALRASGAKVSTIGIGDEADFDMLRTIAETGGGVFYRVVNPAVLPQVFIRAIRLMREPAVRDTPFTPIVVDPDSPVMSGVGPVPTLGGVVLSTRREDASTPVVTPEDEPVTALWPVELGRVAVVATDAHEWAARWAGGPGFARFWTNLTAWATRAVEDAPGELRMVARGDAADLEYEARTEAGEPLDGMRVVGSLYFPDGSERTVELRQTGPGRYEGSVRNLPAGVVVASARATDGDRALPPAIAGIAVRAGAEDQHLTSDEAALARLAARTGGRVLDWTTPASLFERSGDPRVLRTAMWPNLLVAAMVLFIIDVGMRRLAWDRWVEEARHGTEAATRSAASGAIGRLKERRPTAAGPVVEADPQAERLRAERARHERLIAEARARHAPSRPDAGPPAPAQAAPPPEPADEGGLMAAKRRARQRFEERG